MGSEMCIRDSWNRERVTQHDFYYSIGSNVDYRASGVRYQVSGAGYQALGIGYRGSGIGHRVSGIGYQALGIGNRVSGIKHWVSGIGDVNSNSKSCGIHKHNASTLLLLVRTSKAPATTSCLVPKTA